MSKRGRPSKLKIPVKQKDDFNAYHRSYREVKKTTKKSTSDKPKFGSPEWRKLYNLDKKKKKRSK